jgi:hypothetical protein
MYLKQQKREIKEENVKINTARSYGDWLGKMEWKYMVTIRKNYKTNRTVVRNTANKLIKSIESYDRAVYVGEKDSIDYNNYHIHILIDGKDSETLLRGLKNYKNKHKGDLVHIEEIRNSYDAGIYVTKYFNTNTLSKSDIVWDIM